MKKCIAPIEMLKDPQGKLRTQSLFKETFPYALRGKYEPFYTLKDEAEGVISAKKIYLEQKDPSEYKAAMALVGSWNHWQRIVNNQDILPYIEEWREELELLIRSEAMTTIVAIAGAEEKSASSLNAAKFLATGEWKGKKRGRPSKAEVAYERRMAANLEEATANDAKRLGIKFN